LTKKNNTEDKLLLLKQKEKSFSRIIITLWIIVGVLMIVLFTGVLSSIE
jgi:hypothetical protein